MKAIVALLLHVALGIFFIMAIWPAMNGSNEGYTGAVAVVPAVVVEEAAVDAEAEAPVVEEPQEQ